MLSIGSVAPDCKVTLNNVTRIFSAVGFAITIPGMLMLSIMLPCTTTFEKATLVHDTFTIVSAVGSTASTAQKMGRAAPAAASVVG